MRILVIDDSELHQTSARQTLGGHDLTIVGTYDEAYKLLEEPCADWGAVYKELKLRGFKNPDAQDVTEEERFLARAEIERLRTELCPPPSFDAVLSDLLMPASSRTQGDKGLRYVGQAMPVGFALSLMAVLHGAKYVAVVTDMSHHDHPAVALIDPFHARIPHDEYDPEGSSTSFVINTARVGYYFSPETPVEGTICPKCNGTCDKEQCGCFSPRLPGKSSLPRSNCSSCHGTGHCCRTCYGSGKQAGKDWGRVIAHLIA